MKCKHCGFEIKENEKFCTNCGKAISQMENEYPSADNNEKDSETNDLNETGAVEFDEKVQKNSDESLIDTSNNPMKKVLISSSLAISFVFILVLIISMFAVNSSTNKMEKALLSQQAYQVNSLYNEAYGNSSKIEKYDKCISEFLDKVINDINSKVYRTSDLDENGYTVVFRDLQSDWGNLIYTENEDENIYSSISAYNQSKWEELIALINSRAAYCAGVCLLDTNHDPESAIDSFLKVLQTDNCYNSAMDSISACVDMYVEQTMVEIDELIKGEEISAAISKLESINTYLSDKGIETDDVKKKLDETLAEYSKAYCDKAEACFKEKDIDGAIGNIEVALEMQPDNADYKAKYDTYQQYLPYYLYLEDNIITTENFATDWRYFNTHSVANDNSEMSHAIVFGHDQFTNTNIYNVQYNLAGKYDTVSGKIFIPQTYKSNVQTAYFEAYGDGKLLYTSPKIEKGNLPKDISFAVTGIQKLELKFYARTDETLWSSEFGVDSLTAQKAFPKS